MGSCVNFCPSISEFLTIASALTPRNPRSHNATRRCPKILSQKSKMQMASIRHNELRASFTMRRFRDNGDTITTNTGPCGLCPTMRAFDAFSAVPRRARLVTFATAVCLCSKNNPINSHQRPARWGLSPATPLLRRHSIMPGHQRGLAFWRCHASVSTRIDHGREHPRRREDMQCPLIPPGCAL